MARSIQQKLSGISGLADTEKPNKNLLTAAIFTVDQKNQIVPDELGLFLLNPSSLDEHKSSNWVQHNIPGESDPILQWTSGGARTVTFEALVTKDHSGYDLVNPPSFSANLVEQAITVVGNIASSFLGVTVPAIGDLLSIGEQGVGEELSIDSYLNYYRSLLYPYVTNDKTVLSGSPPLVCLFFGKSLSKNLSLGEVGLDTDLWVVTDLRIKITKQLPNLAPMEATVGFTLVQYTKRTKAGIDFSGTAPEGPAPNNGLGQSILNALGI